MQRCTNKFNEPTTCQEKEFSTLSHSKILPIALIMCAVLSFIRAEMWHPVPVVVAAQVTSDSLPTRTVSPTLTALPTNTVIVSSSPTATPRPVSLKWAARLASNTLGVTSGNGSIFRVFVDGRVGLPIEVRNSSLTMTGQSGTKPEYGPFAAEFAPVPKGTWLVSIPSLGVSLPVEADGYNLAVIEFFQRPNDDAPPASPTATNTAIATRPLPTPTPAATITPLPSATPSPTATSTPLPSPSPIASPKTQWLGTVARQNQTHNMGLTVRVAGIEGLAIQLQSLTLAEVVDRRCVTGRDNLGQDTCGFDNLLPGLYTIAPEGLNVRLPVRVTAHETAVALFDKITLPPGAVDWQAKLLKNDNGPTAHPAAEGRLFLRLTGQPGQVVAVISALGVTRLCEMLPNPILGTLTCEVSGLPPGVYRAEAVNTGAGLWLFVDGKSQAEIEFAPGEGEQKTALIVGNGAMPIKLPATPIVAAPVSAVVQPVFTPTVTPTAIISVTATPAFAWQGRVIQTVDLVIGTIGVRAAGLKDHPVIIHSGGWQSGVQLTGTKPELGEYATEFGGLAQGDYIIELVDLAELKVTLGPDQFMLVEFRHQAVDRP
jgi:hypothetical protein